MSAELLLRLLEYFAGIIIVLALLFVLMEASRKFDRLKERSYLTIALGSFVLIVWALMRAMGLNAGTLQLACGIIEISGFLLLGVGYLTLHHQEGDELEAKPPLPTETDPKTITTSKESWVALLTSSGKPFEPTGQKKPSGSTSPEPTAKKEPVATESVPDDKTELKDTKKEPIEAEKAEGMQDADVSAPIVEQKPVVMKAPPKPSGGAVDLSYLASRKRNNKEPKLPTTRRPKQAIAPIALKANPDAQANTTKEPPKTPSEEPPQTRNELLDDLFPLETKSMHHEQEPTLLPGELREPKDKVTKPAPTHPAIGLAGLLGNQELLTLWPQATVVLVVFFIMIELIPYRKIKGNSLLLGGFMVLFAAFIFQAYTSQQGTPLQTIIGLILEVLGFVCLGGASWLKIKGKVTHHFLTIVSIFYLVLLSLAIITATFIIHDPDNLSMLLNVTTGLLIVALPILHAIAYSHKRETVEGAA